MPKYISGGESSNIEVKKKTFCDQKEHPALKPSLSIMVQTMVLV